MTDSTQQSDAASVKARLKDLLKDIAVFIEDATEEQQQRLLSSLEAWRASERREHPRKACSMRVTFATQDLLLRDTVRNISPGGVFIETSAPLSVGQNITLWFSPPHRQDLIKIRGEIVWTPQKGIGVRFISPPSHELERIIEEL